MDAFVPYSIPIQGLKIGIHQYQYALDGPFFSHFEGTPVEAGSIKIDLQLDKRSDMLLLDFSLAGTIKAECDRCTAIIDLPLKDAYQLVVKYGEAEGEAEDEVVFISREASDLNVAQYLYEFTVLTLPITNTYDCQDDPQPPCNKEVLKYLNNETGEQNSGSVWDALKDFKDN